MTRKPTLMPAAFVGLAVAGALGVLQAGVSFGAVSAASPSTTPTPTAAYAPQQRAGVIVPAAVPTGAPFVFSGKGFAADVPLSITGSSAGGVGVGFAAPVAVPFAASRTISSSGSGTFSTAIALPHPGGYTFVATGMGPEGRVVSVSASVVVMGSKGSSSSPSASPSVAPVTSSAAGGSSDTTAAPAAGSALPKTGADGVGTELGVGGGLIVLGAAAVAFSVARRRRSAADPAS